LREVSVEPIVRFNPLKNDSTGSALVMHLPRIVTRLRRQFRRQCRCARLTEKSFTGSAVGLFLPFSCIHLQTQTHQNSNGLCKANANNSFFLAVFLGQYRVYG
jgi:hypothetical protein